MQTSHDNSESPASVDEDLPEAGSGEHAHITPKVNVAGDDEITVVNTEEITEEPVTSESVVVEGTGEKYIGSLEANDSAAGSQGTVAVVNTEEPTNELTKKVATEEPISSESSGSDESVAVEEKADQDSTGKISIESLETNDSAGGSQNIELSETEHEEVNDNLHTSEIISVNEDVTDSITGVENTTNTEETRTPDNTIIEKVAPINSEEGNDTNEFTTEEPSTSIGDGAIEADKDDNGIKEKAEVEIGLESANNEQMSVEEINHSTTVKLDANADDTSESKIETDKVDISERNEGTDEIVDVGTDISVDSTETVDEINTNTSPPVTETEEVKVNKTLVDTYVTWIVEEPDKVDSLEVIDNTTKGFTKETGTSTETDELSEDDSTTSKIVEISTAEPIDLPSIDVDKKGLVIEDIEDATTDSESPLSIDTYSPSSVESVTNRKGWYESLHSHISHGIAKTKSHIHKVILILPSSYLINVQINRGVCLI